jgi:hypothetical protein
VSGCCCLFKLAPLQPTFFYKMRCARCGAYKKARAACEFILGRRCASESQRTSSSCPCAAGIADFTSVGYATRRCCAAA